MSTAPPSRRDAIALLGGSALLLGTASARAQNPTPQAVIQNALREGQRFDPAAVTEIARALSRRPFVPVPNDLPEAFASLTYDQYIAVKAMPQARLWEGENRGFTAEPLHRGFVFTNPVALFVVEDGGIRRIVFDRSLFDFGTLNVPPTVGDIGYSGVRLSTVIDGQPMVFAILQGATFFRAVARGQTFGLDTRALTLNPAETRGEEFPFFRAFWIERPVLGTNAVVVHGLIDSQSTTGSVRMTFRPGDSTIVDVETTLFPRVNLEHVGLGGMGATYLFGPNARRIGTDEVRPAVYDASGLQMLNGQDEWLWRPLKNPDALQLSSFVDQNPRGFGLLQRDRDPATFQDEEQRYERRPSLWIEPIGDWGQGSVALIEIPSDSELNHNVLAYWRPRTPMAAGSEVALAYRQFWCWTPPARPPNAIVVATRSGRGSGGRRRRFLVEFAGETLADPAAVIKPVLTTTPGTVQRLRTWPAPERKTCRVSFDLDPGNENACEMRLFLEAGGKPVSEAWLYRWTP